MCHDAKTDRALRAISPDEVPEGHWFNLIRRYSTSIPMYITYGKRVHRIANNPQVAQVYDVVGNFTRMAQPGNYLADVVPFLRMLPDILAPWRSEAGAKHRWEMELYGGLLEEEKDALNYQGTVRDSFLNTYLRARAAAGYATAHGNGTTTDMWMRDTMLAYTAGTILEAGSDTTATAILAFVLYMLNYPAVMKRAREEIDSVVGSERMPNFDDEDNLPYVVACVQELLRCHPPIIMGIPHRADEDDDYKGYHIPKGTTVIGNLWSIHMDPVKYPDPTNFNPERFLGESMRRTGGPDAQAQVTARYAFGFGRRFCAGKDVGEASLFIVCSRILWGLDFFAPMDPEIGKARIPNPWDEEATWTKGFIAVPKPFSVQFSPRTEKHAEIIRLSFEELQDEWKDAGLPGDER
ncbi:hypothetical protein CERSUDRAFT_60535 [Gelatoporia subvermispora B]|uniref:Cytochrome P450 n=1 Tax=Ceriporiopsis subvermispora (strain B) TaxID=914234 RepID=M2QGB1_CERS8|nr:hypothetical protein CERSUDRAFT_60535 [Gelatoporia subvermispora B]